jgi:hypothetical protein
MVSALWFAQDAATTDPSESAFFPWISLDGGFQVDWAVGLVYAFVGIIGALVFVYFAFDEALPGMGGLTRLNDLEAELRELERKRAAIAETRQQLLAETTVDADRLAGLDALTKSYDGRVQEKLAAITRVRRMRLVAGMPLYIVLGGVVASAFATNLLQAVIIGFGWTGVVQSIGLRHRSAEIKETSTKEVEEVREAFNDQLEQVRTSAEDRVQQIVRDLRTAVLALSTAVARDPKAPAGSAGTSVTASEIRSVTPAPVANPPVSTDGGTLDPDVVQVVNAVRTWLRGVLGGGREGTR